MTKNITLAVDENVLDRVRIIAAERKTTVNGLVRDFLERMTEQEDRVSRARKRIRELAKKSKAEVGPITWKRGELYER